MVDAATRGLLGYISIPQLTAMLAEGRVRADDELRAAMTRFQRRGAKYQVITMNRPLEDLEAFFAGAATGRAQDCAVITDERRRFVLGVATVQDLEDFVNRRPA